MYLPSAPDRQVSGDRWENNTDEKTEVPALFLDEEDHGTPATSTDPRPRQKQRVRKRSSPYPPPKNSMIRTRLLRYTAWWS